MNWLKDINKRLIQRMQPFERKEKIERMLSET